jgi:opacity protein-like surface antigen
MRRTIFIVIAVVSISTFGEGQTESTATVSVTDGWISQGLSVQRSGYLAEISASEGFSKNFLYSLSVGYHYWTSGTTNVAEKLTDVPVWGGIRWWILSSNVSPYLSFEVGLHLLHRDVERQSSDVMPTPYVIGRSPEGPTSEDIGRIGLRIGVGVAYDFTEKVQLDMAGCFVYINHGFIEIGNVPESTPPIRHADLQLGVGYRL